MVSDLDIRRTAKVLIDFHGDRARAEAESLAATMAARADAEGRAVWARIIAALDEMQGRGD